MRKGKRLGGRDTAGLQQWQDLREGETPPGSAPGQRPEVRPACFSQELRPGETPRRVLMSYPPAVV